MDDLKAFGDQVFNKLPNGIAVLFSKGEEKPMALIIVSKTLNDSGLIAGDLAKEIGTIMGGGGGGKPHMATAGGKDNSRLESSINQTKELINNLENNL